MILKLSQKKKPRAKPKKILKKIKTTKKPVHTPRKPHAHQEEINTLGQSNLEVVGHILKQWLNEEGKKKD